jgi:nitrile hydratase
MDGFGPVQRETGEPVFHEPWESRVFGMFLTGAGLPPRTGFDAARHLLEQLDPVEYLSSSYYERWLAAMENALIAAGSLNAGEIEARMQQLAADPHRPIERRDDPVRAESLVNAFRAGLPATRKIRQKPHFAIGDKIVTRNLNPHGHTRLPRYARGKRGVIVAHHGAHVFPNSNAHGLGENPQHLYTVRLAVRELWGDGAEPNESVLIDLWESYLEKDKAAAESSKAKRTTAARRIIARTSQAAGKISARAASPKRVAKPLQPVALKSSAVARKRKRGGAGITPASGSTGGRASGKPMRRSR